MSDEEKTDEAQDIEQSIDEATEAVAVQASRLEELSGDTAQADGGDGVGLGHLMDVPVQVTVELGRTRMSLGELVELTPGALLELDRAEHEPADILVNGKIVARGEVVTIGRNYGVRITEVA